MRLSSGWDILWLGSRTSKCLMTMQESQLSLLFLRLLLLQEHTLHLGVLLVKQMPWSLRLEI